MYDYAANEAYESASRQSGVRRGLARVLEGGHRHFLAALGRPRQRVRASKFEDSPTLGLHSFDVGFAGAKFASKFRSRQAQPNNYFAATSSIAPTAASAGHRAQQIKSTRGGGGFRHPLRTAMIASRYFDKSARRKISEPGR